MNRLHEKYNKEIAKNLKKELSIDNVMAVPKLEKVTVNVGLSKALTDNKFKENIVNTLTRITGQKPVLTKAKKSISNFKIREGQEIGAVVTLRGEKMWHFVDKLVSIALPRVRDFRGLNSKSVDQKGNLSIGIKEHIVFPEIGSDEVESLHGLEVCISTTADSSAQGLALFKALGFPIKK